MSTTKQRPAMHRSVEEVAESGLIGAERWAELMADLESRLGMAYDREGHPISNAIIATFPDGRRMLYSQLPHDPEHTYCRRQLLESLLTDAECRLIDSTFYARGAARREAERFAKASYVPASCWKGPVCDGDRHWPDVDSYLQEHDDMMEDLIEDGTMADMVQLPAYVWAARPEPVIHSCTVDEIFESQICDRGWEDMTVHDLNGVPELQAAIDAFVKANETVTANHVDFHTAVILPMPAGSVAPATSSTALPS